jgi:hypothetical protein
MFDKHLVQKSDITRAYQQSPSFVDLLPWRDFNENYKCILLEDNKSWECALKLHLYRVKHDQRRC